MTTRAEFVQKARAAGLDDAKIKAAMAQRRVSLGAFDDDPSPASSPAAPAAAPAAAPSQAPTPGPRAERISLSEMAFPATTAYAAKNGNDFSLGRAGAMLKDVISAPKRILDANAEIAGNQSPDAVIAAITNTQARNPVDAIGREAPLMALPAMRLSGQGISRISSAFGAGVAESAPSVAVHQLERKAEGQNFSAVEAAKEALMGGAVRGGFEAAGQVARRIVPWLRTHIAGLSGVDESTLEKAATPEGMQRLKQAVPANPEAGLTPQADALGRRVDELNTQRSQLAEGSRATQAARLEEDLVGLHTPMGSKKAQRLKDVSASNRGETLTSSIQSAKDPMHQAYLEGEAKAIGPLREGPALMAELPAQFKNIMAEFKMLPDQGITPISKPGQRIADEFLSMAENKVGTLDDLLNMKSRLRHAREQVGADPIFDKTRDDLVLGRFDQAIDAAVEASVRQAVPSKQAEKVIALFKANNQQYAQTKQLLSKLDNSIGRIKNSENIIGQIEGLGPVQGWELNRLAMKNPVLKPVVQQLRQGFKDGLLLEALQGGKVSPDAFIKKWANLSDDMKAAWLDKADITRIDEAVERAQAAIDDPEVLGKTLGIPGRKNEANIVTRLENLGGDKALNREALQELVFLDDMMGLKGDQRFSQQALEFFEAKSLGMTGKSHPGKPSSVPMAQTGRAGLGAQWGDWIGGGIGGAAGLMASGLGAAAEGAIIGGAITKAAKGAYAYSQSPAGAILVFRALRRLEGAYKSPAVEAGRETLKLVAPQGLRSVTSQPKAQRIER